MVDGMYMVDDDMYMVNDMFMVGGYPELSPPSNPAPSLKKTGSGTFFVVQRS